MKKISKENVMDLLLSLKENTKAILGILIVLFLLDMVVVVRGQTMPLMRLFSKAGQLKTDIKQAKDDIKLSAAYKNKLINLQAQLLDLEKKVVLEEGLPVALEQISKYADASDVKILKMRPIVGKTEIIKVTSSLSASGDPEQEFFRQNVSLTVRAGFHQLGRFLALLESSKVFFGVQRFEVQTNEQEPAEQMATLVLELVVRKA